MEKYELYIHSNAVEANCTEIEEQYSSGSRFCRRKQDFLVWLQPVLSLIICIAVPPNKRKGFSEFVT